MKADSLLKQQIEELTGELSEVNKQLKEEMAFRRQFEKKLHEKEHILRTREADFRSLAGKLLSDQEAERKRLAREMHDDLTQRLAVMAIDADQLIHQFHNPKDGTHLKLRQLFDLLYLIC